MGSHSLPLLLLLLLFGCVCGLTALESVQIHQQCHSKCQKDHLAIKQCYQRCSHAVQNRLSLHRIIPERMRKKIIHMIDTAKPQEVIRAKQEVVKSAVAIRGRLIKRKIL